MWICSSHLDFDTATLLKAIEATFKNRETPVPEEELEAFTPAFRLVSGATGREVSTYANSFEGIGIAYGCEGSCSRVLDLRRRMSELIKTVSVGALVEILAPKGCDQSLDKRMRARHEGDGLAFLDVENSQIRPPAMKPEQWGPDRACRQRCQMHVVADALPTKNLGPGALRGEMPFSREDRV